MGARARSTSLVARAATLVVALVWTAAAGVPAGAAPGDFDLTYAGDGTLELDEEPLDVVVADDGTTYVVGSANDTLLISRYDATGQADLSYGTDGTAAVELPADPESFVAGAMAAVLADGSVMTVVHVYRPMTEDHYDYWRSSLHRVLPGGTPDAAFGRKELTNVAPGPYGAQIEPIADGVLLVAGGLQHWSSAGVNVASLTAPESLGSIGIDGQGRIYGFTKTVGPPSTYRAHVWRFTPDLQVDETYGSSGVVDLAPIVAAGGGLTGNRPSLAVATTVDQVGNATAIVHVRHAPGCFCPVQDVGTVAVRLTPSGTPDATFDGDGRAVLATGSLSEITSMDLTGAGGYVVATYSHGYSLAQRLTSFAPDTGFSGDGVLELPGFRWGGAWGGSRYLVHRAVLPDHLLSSLELADGELPAPPGPPMDAGVDIEAGSITVSWTPPGDIGGGPLTGYEVQAFEDGSTEPTFTQDVAATATTANLLTNPSLHLGHTYRFTVRALNGGGFGPASPPTSTILPPFPTALALVVRQLDDFAGRPPTQAEEAELAGGVDAGTLSPGHVVEAAMAQSPSPHSLDPVIRLYQAYFLRVPDVNGLRYWHARYLSGTSLKQISKSFAASAEFQARYGALTNGGFVALVYENVLGRAADEAGQAFWTAKLDSGAWSRGRVMLHFSESSEHVGKMAGEVTVVAVFLGMLERVPSSAEMAALEPGATTGGVPVVAAHVLSTEEYFDLVVGA